MEENQEQEPVQPNEEPTGNEQLEAVDNEPQENPIDEAKLFEYAATKLGKEVKSWDDFYVTKEVEKVVEKVVEKPLMDDDEITSAYKKYKKDTGRGFDDFIKLQENIDNKSEDLRLLEYMKFKNPYLDEEDIAYKIGKMKAKMNTEEDEFDAEILDRAREAKIEWKMQLAEATNWQKKLQEQYLVPKVAPVEEAKVDNSEVSKVFEDSIKESARNYKVKFDDFEYEVPTSVDKYSTLEKFFDIFKNQNGDFSYQDFIDAAEFKLNRDSILKAYRENLQAKFMDDNMKRMNNAKPIEQQPNQGTEYTNYDSFKSTFNPAF